METDTSNQTLSRRLAARFGFFRLFRRVYFFLRWLPAQLATLWHSRPNLELTTELGTFTVLPLTRTVTESNPTFQAHLHHWVTNAPAGIFVDIGAGTGLFSHLAVREGSARSALAFEPNPSVYALLAKNIADNNLAADAVNAAAGHQSGRLTLSPHSVATGGTSTCGGGSGVSVPAIALDTFLTERDINPQDLSCIRVSTAGHELSTLQGMPTTLDNMPAGSRLWVDVWSDNEVKEITLDFINQAGFTLRDQSGSQHLFVKS